MSGAAKVLVVDDQPVIARTLSRALASKGFLVHCASSYDEARCALERERFEAVLLDQKLGDAKGMDLLPVVVEHNSDSVVLLLSGYLDGSIAVDAARRGVYAIPKPVRAPEIAGLIDHLLSCRPHRSTVASFCERYKLSAREAEVVHLAVRGLQNKTIATQLGCASSTVMSYWRRIYEKVDCSTRAEVFSMVIAHLNDSDV